MVRACNASSRLIAKYFNFRGNAKKDVKDYEGAIADYSKAISINPDDADTYINRGNAKKNLGDYEGAMEDFDLAIKLDSQNIF
jgi:tetratricopeptide (TPR) repeat protein